MMSRIMTRMPPRVMIRMIPRIMTRMTPKITTRMPMCHSDVVSYVNIDRTCHVIRVGFISFYKFLIIFKSLKDHKS